MTFTDLLGELVELVGWPVRVTAMPAEGFPVLAVEGAIMAAIELTDGDPSREDDDVFFVALGVNFDSGIVLIRALFRGAEWNLGELHVRQGDMLVTIDPS